MTDDYVKVYRVNDDFLLARIMDTVCGMRWSATVVEGGISHGHQYGYTRQHAIKKALKRRSVSAKEERIPLSDA